MHKTTKTWIRSFQFIGIGLFIFIVSRLDLRVVLGQLLSLKISWLFVYAACFFLTILFKTLRWRIALSAQGHSLRLLSALRIYLISSFLGIVTPPRVGEASKIVYLSREHVPVTKSLVSVLLDRLYDIASLTVIGILGLIYFAQLFFSDFFSLVLSGAMILALALLVYFFRQHVWDFATDIVQKIVPGEIYLNLSSGWIELKAGLWAVGRSTRIQMTLLTIVSYLFYFPQPYAIARGLGLDISFVYLSFCLALATLVSLMPVSVGGLGTREATFVGLLGRVGIPAEAAVLVSFLDGAVLSIFVTGLSAIAFMIFVKTEQE